MPKSYIECDGNAYEYRPKSCKTKSLASVGLMTVADIILSRRVDRITRLHVFEVSLDFRSNKMFTFCCYCILFQ